MVSEHFSIDSEASPVIIFPIIQEGLAHWLEQAEPAMKNWVQASRFKAKPGSHCLIPDTDGGIQRVLLGVRDRADYWSFGALPTVLPEGTYQIEGPEYDVPAWERICLAWALGAYQFDRYKKAEPRGAGLVPPVGVDVEYVSEWATSIGLLRDWVNTPPDDMNPESLEEAAVALAKECGAKHDVIVGDKLLKKNYPAVHAVGRGAAIPPRLVDLRWGDEKHPKLTLVGKGVCFDTGGLDIKPRDGMRDMKEDMGGAAHVLCVARMVMKMELPVRLRVLVPAVENAVSGASYHPSDVITTRSGISVEVHDTDAEGRLILCDALAEAATEDPDCVIDMATLTGAARVGLGDDIPAFFTRQRAVQNELWNASDATMDLIWPLPLYEPYQYLLKSNIADVSNVPRQRFGGAITAALFLERFIQPKSVDWIHFDLPASNVKTSPGRPEGGEAHGVRAVFEFLKRRYVG